MSKSFHKSTFSCRPHVLCPWLPPHFIIFGEKKNDYVCLEEILSRNIGFLVDNCKKWPLGTTMGGIEQHSLNQRQSWLPFRKQVSLKATERKGGLFY